MLDRLRKIRHIALDMDGTIYLDGRIFACTLPFLECLHRRGIGYSFLTNNSSHSRREYLLRLKGIGIEATPEQVYISTHATADYIHQQMPGVRRLFVLGMPAMQQEMAELGFEICEGEDEPDAVVVGFDRNLVYERLCQAAWWISRGKPFIATHPDRVCPTSRPTVLVDCGSICKALQEATGIAPIVIGKPDPRMLQGLLARHHLMPEQLAMVGDRLSTDMALAKASGVLGVLVLTGEATREEAMVSPWRPDLIVADLGELTQQLER